MLGVADPTPNAPAGFRTPFREDDGALYLIDQRRLPDALVEVETKSAGEVAYAIREMIVRGAPAIGQVAAIGLALSAERVRDARPYARRATLRGGANALINVPADGGQPALGGRPDDGPLRGRSATSSEDGDAIADAIRAEADAIVFEATTDHGRLATFGLEALPVPDRRAAAHPHPLQHGTARLRPVRDRARRRPGGAPRRPRRSTSGSTRPGRTCRARG